VLEDAIPSRARLTVGVTVVSIAADDEKASAVFTDGTAGTYDLVVGADGVRSIVRRLVFGEELRPGPLGQVGYRWTTSALPGLDHGTMFLGAGAVKLGLWPLADGRVYAFLTKPDRAMERPGPESLRKDVAGALEQFSFRGAEQLRADLPGGESIHFGPFQALLMPAPWVIGRVVLIGDAAHVMPPHGSSGAAMAIEDAAVLADELRRAGDVPHALKGFMERRYERVKRVVRYSTKNCLAENDAADAGGRAPLLDPGEAAAFWQFLRQPI
jgi:2-polyprenyl-6-methoxyphenol hydroxylase-like FAD-dependent oxidoreductase